MLKANNIVAAYGGRYVLHGISLEIKEGEFVAIIGPNGSGKSTLAKCLTGYLAPREGEVLLEGKKISEWKSKERAKRIAFVPQEIVEPLPFRVKDYVQLGRFPYRGVFDIESNIDKESIDRAISLTGIERLAERKLTELSGGERQLVYVARALAQESRIIVLDEPISQLDVGHAILIMDVLASLNNEGVGLVVVLHDINIASDYAERVIALKDGKIFADGIPSKIFNFETVENLFETVCVVRENPISKKPFVYPVPKKYRM